MYGTVDKRFLAALETVMKNRPEDRPELQNAVEDAIAKPSAEAVQKVRDLLQALPHKDLTTLMQEMHRHMATDLSAIWSQMPHAVPDEKPN